MWCIWMKSINPAKTMRPSVPDPITCKQATWHSGLSSSTLPIIGHDLARLAVVTFSL